MITTIYPTYKGITYFFNFNSLYDLKRGFFCLHDKKFLTDEDVKRYIDKVVLRKKKLERLKVISG